MNIEIDGKVFEAGEGRTILDAAEDKGIHIPTLCYMREINCISVCRVCMVEANGKLVPACSTPLREGMKIVTDSEHVRMARRKNLELICSDHNMDCTDCPRGADCELRELCREYEVDDRAYGPGRRKAMVDDSSPWLIRDNAKCILCRRCEAVCSKVQGVKALAANRKGGDTNIGFGLPLTETDCVGCGQCAAACPTGALTPKDDTKPVWKAIFDREKFVVAAVSPSAYFRIGELFGEKELADRGGKVAAILRKIGFDAVFDMSGEESRREDIMRQLAPDTEGMAVSGACPAWRRYVKKFHPELFEKLIIPASGSERLSKACAGAADGREIFAVHFSNCIAGKDGDLDFDAELSTRELFNMIQRACVSSFTAQKIWSGLKEEAFDSLDAPCADVKAALRESLCEKTGHGVRTAVVTGLANAEKLLEQGQVYDLLEVYACPGGCLNGGGMPGIKDGLCPNVKKGDGVLTG